MTILEIKNLGKSYRLYRSEWHRFARWFGIQTKHSQENWVLRGISFSILQGEAIGIIGRNGAGKSTLLKIVTGVLQPTEGTVTIKGRIAAILELGMGFNQELTARQNVYHTAGLMGFSEKQIKHAMPEIEAFAEIGAYFNEPMRTYSSGMQMRVAFAVATAWRPEVLIIDEALSVGDAYFQHKSFNRIREFQIKGTTLFLVSHDKAAIQALCKRAILLEQGKVLKDGSPEEVFDYYNALIAEKENYRIEIKQTKTNAHQTVSGSGEARFTQILLFNKEEKIIDTIEVGQLVIIKATVEILVPIKSLVLGYSIKDRLGQVMYGTNTWHTKQIITGPNIGKYEYSISFQANLGPGSYSLQLALVDSDTHLSRNYEWRDLALVFNVINKDKTTFIGCLWNEPQIEIKDLK